MFKIPVEIEEPNHLFMISHFAEKSKSKNDEKLLSKIEKYNFQIKEAINSIKHSSYKMNFFKSYSENPLKFSQAFMQQNIGIRNLLNAEEKQKKIDLAKNIESADFYKSNIEFVQKSIEDYIYEESEKEKNNEDSPSKKRGRKRTRFDQEMSSKNKDAQSEIEDEKNEDELHEN